ncbi:hypothetical protein [Georgenia sp. AZ-5]|uniref:hypothetical protein n=1 Tax=Georgenia sp. AZ-5 TaxID=3367526 RepID=UPI003754BD30
MAAGKTRLVRFYEPWIEEGSNIRLADADFWHYLHQEASGRPAEERRITVRGTDYFGLASEVDGTPYIYFGRRRKESDFPDHEFGDDQTGPLPEGLRLVEPMYLVPFGPGNTVATIRTSGGPTLSAVEKWISRLVFGIEVGATITLTPILRQDAAAKLDRAVAVTKLNVKLDRHVDVPEGDGRVLTALREASAAAHGEATIDLELSFGGLTPLDGESDDLRTGLQQLAGRPGVKKAKGTVVVPHNNGIRRQHIDFVKDVITHTVTVGESEMERPSPSGMVGAALEAIDAFREDRESRALTHSERTGSSSLGR